MLKYFTKYQNNYITRSIWLLIKILQTNQISNKLGPPTKIMNLFIPAKLYVIKSDKRHMMLKVRNMQNQQGNLQLLRTKQYSRIYKFENIKNRCHNIKHLAYKCIKTH